MAIQLARQVPELIVIATASRPETQAWVAELGAHHVIDHRQPLARQVANLGIGAPALVFSTTHTDEHIEQIAELIAACRRYPGASNARRITFEYIMLRGVNDSEAEARELVRLIAGIPAKVNLIPFNPWPGSDYRPSGRDALERFAAIVQDAGFAAPIRMPRGQDILAACGQLRTDSRRTRPAA